MSAPKARRSDDKKAIQELQKAWVREVSRGTGLLPTPLAKSVDLSETALTRIFKDDYDGMLSPATIKPIADKYGVPGPEAWDALGRPPLLRLAEEAVPFKFDGGDRTTEAAIKALLGGRKGLEPMILKTRSLEDAGYLPGDVVILDPSRGSTAEPRDIVCAQVYEAGGATTIWRRFDKPFLSDLTRDADHRAAPEYVDERRVVIVGVVVGMVRPEKRAA